MRVRDRLMRGKAFVAYLTAGDPDLRATELFVRALARGGADVIELGVPHSDPVADGKTNQRAAERALGSGTTLEGILLMAERLRDARVTVPLVIFSYVNPIFRMGLERFARACRESGIDAVLAVDLPPEESRDYRHALFSQGVGTVFLASPTTKPERLHLIDDASTEFVYYVSRAGVTGARSDLTASLGEEVRRLKENVKNPVCIGFGISTPDQVRNVTAMAEGVIVGSALVQEIERAASPEAAAARLESLTKELKGGQEC